MVVSNTLILVGGSDFITPNNKTCKLIGFLGSLTLCGQLILSTLELNQFTQETELRRKTFLSLPFVGVFYFPRRASRMPGCCSQPASGSLPRREKEPPLTTKDRDTLSIHRHLDTTYVFC